jgi:hypothetical protein
MNPLRQTAGVLLIATRAISGLGYYMVYSLVSAFSTLERFDAPGSRDATLEPGDYTVYWETPGAFVGKQSRGSEVQVRVAAQDGQGDPAVNSSGLWVSRYSTGSRVGVSVADFRIERRGVYTVSAGKTLPGGGIAITRGLGFFGVFRLVLTTLALVGGGVGGGLVILLRSK